MKIRMIQMDIVRSIQDNYEQSIQLSIRRSLEDVDVLIFPEMFLTGFYEMKNIRTRSFKKSSPEIKFFQNLALKTSTNIILGSLPLMRTTKSLSKSIQDETIRNTALVINRSGKIIHDYSKIHLFPLMNEVGNLTSGTRLKVFQIDNFSAAIIICYDLRFPELLVNLHRDASPDIIFVPMQWPYPRTEVFQTLLQARAIENQCFILGCNRVGEDRSERFEGGSMVISPAGKVIRKLGRRMGSFDVEIDKSQIAKERRRFSFLSRHRNFSK
ncbi:hydrolase in agr operon-like [Ylistrum balloti]|uniref:hydrolase in agr operon-like n=1 Tax=Ylistrum balloti TaxID=509963 RepID=UPI0029059515|nr:hydrolase in agr operon-like [Ylistrum balloti]